MQNLRHEERASQASRYPITCHPAKIREARQVGSVGMAHPHLQRGGSQGGNISLFNKRTTVVLIAGMKIYVHAQVYERVKDVAHAQGRTKSDLVQDALVRYLGMECVQLDDEVVYGKDELKDESPNA